MIQALAYLANARCLFDCISSTAYRSPFSHTVLNADGRIHAVTCVRLFFSFSLYKFLHLLTFAHFFFLRPSFFQRTFPLSHLNFHRPKLHSSARFNRRDHLLVCFTV